MKLTIAGSLIFHLLDPVLQSIRDGDLFLLVVELWFHCVRDHEQEGKLSDQKREREREEKETSQSRSKA